MAQLAEASGGVTLHTEAKSIRDWRSVCDHIISRCGGISTETAEFLKLFQALTETYKQYRDMCDNMRNIITTQKEYVEVPDYHETYVLILSLFFLFFDSTFMINYI